MVLEVGNQSCGVLKLCNLESLDSEFTWCWKLGTSVVGLGLDSLLSPVPGPLIAGFKSCPKKELSTQPANWNWTKNQELLSS
jgi:hypothetical protein